MINQKYLFALLVLFVGVGPILASDELSIDSLFQKQSGLRSITSLQLLSSGNAHSYYLYPNLSISGDPRIWTDTKELSLNQTFLYTFDSSFDVLVSANGSYARKEQDNLLTHRYSWQNDLGFHALWLGLVYTAKSIDGFVPQITFQTAVIQKEKALFEGKNFFFKSQNLQVALRGYSDPVIYSLYGGIGYNHKRQFSFAKIQYGQAFYMGGDLSVVLSPKISLDLGAEQRFQTRQKINGIQNSQLRSIPTFSLGSTYSLDSKNALSVSGSFGGSSAAPDAVFGVSWWKRF